jgi:hypothetical protein
MKYCIPYVPYASLSRAQDLISGCFIRLVACCRHRPVLMRPMRAEGIPDHAVRNGLT